MSTSTRCSCSAPSGHPKEKNPVHLPLERCWPACSGLALLAMRRVSCRDSLLNPQLGEYWMGSYASSCWLSPPCSWRHFSPVNLRISTGIHRSCGLPSTTTCSQLYPQLGTTWALVGFLNQNALSKGFCATN